MAGSCRVHGGLRAALRVGRALGLTPLGLVPPGLALPGLAPPGLAPLSAERVRGAAERVVVSVPGAVFGSVVSLTVAALALLAVGYNTYHMLEMGASFSIIWYAGTVLETGSAALVVGAAGVLGARRMARLVRFIDEIQTINVANNIDKVAKDTFGARWVWLALGAALAQHAAALALIAYSTRDVVIVACCFIKYIPNICKFVIVLQYVCQVAVVNSSLAAIHGRLDEIIQELSSNEDYDNIVYTKAYETIKAANYSYLALCRLLRRLNRQEGPLLLAVLAVTVVKTVLALNMFVSVAVAPGRTSTFAIAEIICIINSMNFMVLETVQVMLPMETSQRTADLRALERRRGPRPCTAFMSLHCVTIKIVLGSLQPAVSEGLTHAAPGGALAEELVRFQESLQSTPVSIAPLDICSFSRPFMISLVSFYTSTAVVMRQFHLKTFT